MNAVLVETSCTVESVVKSRLNGPLLAAAAVLWIKPDDKVLDVTYGRGNFWTVFRPEKLVCHDIALDGVDFRELPESDSSMDVVVFDPPYIAQGGRATSLTQDFMDRYGLREAPETAGGIKLLYEQGMAEANRVLAMKGRLMVKCMDYVNGGSYIAARHHVVETALKLGLVQVDEFVHHSGAGPQPNHSRQLHSRRTHSFLCVFEKRKKSG